jgi:5-methyltetrahydropteroyltriglutamate--homocysteine methyltransferase
VASRLTDTGAEPSLDEARFATALAPRLKVTLPSPFFFCQLWHPEVSAAAYADPFEMFADAADVLRRQVEALDAFGVAEIQIDADEIAVLVDPEVRERYAATGLDPERLLTDGADLLNELVAGISTPTALHMCRGNFKGNWMAAGDWEAIAPTVFPRLGAFDSLLLEFDGPRCGSFVGLRHVLPEQTVVLGLVSSKEPPRFGPEQVAARVRAASRHVPLERLAVSPAAGFAPAPEGNPLSPDDQKRALQLVIDTAEVAW